MIKKENKKKHTFLFVVSNKRSKRNGKYTELLGVYNQHKKYFILNKNRFGYWLSHGLSSNINILKLLKKFNII